MALNILPARQAFVGAGGLLTPEAARFFNDLYDRVGRANGLGSDDLAVLSQMGDSGGAVVSALRAEVEALRTELASMRDGAAMAADAKWYAQQLEVVQAFEGYQVNWASPGAIGYYTPNTGSFSIVDAAGGSAAKPSFYMRKDSATGWFSGSAGSWGFAVGGVAMITLDESGMEIGRQLRSTVPTGAPPFQVFSTTKVPNLYVDRAALADNATTADVLTAPSTYPADATDLSTCIALANALKSAALLKRL